MFNFHGTSRAPSPTNADVRCAPLRKAFNNTFLQTKKRPQAFFIRQMSAVRKQKGGDCKREKHIQKNISFTNELRITYDICIVSQNVFFCNSLSKKSCKTYNIKQFAFYTKSLYKHSGGLKIREAHKHCKSDECKYAYRFLLRLRYFNVEYKKHRTHKQHYSVSNCRCFCCKRG